MAHMQSPEQPLALLPAMLNLVLLQTSKILRDSNSQNLRQAGLTRGRITGIVSSANQRFHEALDEIEIEILQAKAVMERDLRNIRKKRAERDRARDRANGIPSPSSLLKEADERSQQADEVGPNSIISSIVQLDGVDEVDALFGESQADSEAKTNEGNVVGADQGMPRDSENSAGLAITMPSDTAVKAQDQTKDDGKQSADGTNAAETMLDTADPANVDYFESMFDDSDLVGADDTMDFGDFGFSMDATASQEIGSDGTLQNTVMNNVDMNNMASTSNEDINSLLPGLENYVTGADFSSIGMPITSTQPDSTQAAVAVASSAPAPDAAGATSANANFDDDFFGLNFDMHDTGGDDMGDGTFGDLEDFNWD